MVDRRPLATIFWSDVNTNREQRRYGFTLVEILVVLSIFAILAAVSIPTFARYGVFSKNELQRSSLELHNLLKAARVHASTYRVDTAVVYMLDSYVSPEENPDNRIDPATPAGVGDSLTGATLRVITGAAVMVKIQNGESPYAGKFVPAPGELGSFVTFPGRMVVLLNSVDDRNGPAEVYYRSARPRFDPNSDDPADVLPSGLPKLLDIAKLGLRSVDVVDVVAVVEGREILNGLDDDGDDHIDEGLEVRPLGCFPAHIFKPTGGLDASDQERFTIHVTMWPEESVDNRLVNPEIPQFTIPGSGAQNLITVPIELYRTTGRIQIAR